MKNKNTGNGKEQSDVPMVSFGGGGGWVGLYTDDDAQLR